MALKPRADYEQDELRHAAFRRLPWQVQRLRPGDAALRLEQLQRLVGMHACSVEDMLREDYDVFEELASKVCAAYATDSRPFGATLNGPLRELGEYASGDEVRFTVLLYGDRCERYETLELSGPVVQTKQDLVDSLARIPNDAQFSLGRGVIHILSETGYELARVPVSEYGDHRPPPARRSRRVP
jgi:hypothetical protein